MRFDHSRLKEQLPHEQYETFISEFSQDEKTRESIISRVREEGIHKSSLEIGFSKAFQGFRDMDFKDITFEKIDEERIKFYIQ
ncbi:hypothetical protein [Salimicrobium humidisoli]|uniref:Uncharacterized protein n=1 Tax=Salimicrobium humidisoli TaxID=2029857 RepID=A0ABX4HNW6_9BACI|nr:hypothetical protein [Salimicrobium humidisoli]PBB04758.1 hypothetical protein CKW00_12305 [Salimicrobium humidisoli]